MTSLSESSHKKILPKPFPKKYYTWYQVSYLYPVLNCTQCRLYRKKKFVDGSAKNVAISAERKTLGGSRHCYKAFWPSKQSNQDILFLSWIEIQLLGRKTLSVASAAIQGVIFVLSVAVVQCMRWVQTKPKNASSFGRFSIFPKFPFAKCRIRRGIFIRCSKISYGNWKNY